MRHHDSEAQRQLLEPLSTKWIQNAAGISRDTAAAWRKGRKPRPDQWEKFLTAFTAWRRGLPDVTKEAAPPQWARRLNARVNAIALEVLGAEVLAEIEAADRAADELERDRRQSSEVRRLNGRHAQDG